MWRRYEAVSFKVFPPSTFHFILYHVHMLFNHCLRKEKAKLFFYYCFFFDLYWRLLREKVCLTRVSKIFRTWKRIGYRRVKIIFFIIFLFLLEIGVKKNIFKKIGIHLIQIYLLYEKGNANKRMCFPYEKICDFQWMSADWDWGSGTVSLSYVGSKYLNKRFPLFVLLAFTKKYVLVQLSSIYELESGDRETEWFPVILFNIRSPKYLSKFLRQICGIF